MSRRVQKTEVEEVVTPGGTQVVKQSVIEEQTIQTEGGVQRFSSHSETVQVTPRHTDQQQVRQPQTAQIQHQEKAHDAPAAPPPTPISNGTHSEKNTTKIPLQKTPLDKADKMHEAGHVPVHAEKKTTKIPLQKIPLEREDKMHVDREDAHIPVPAQGSVTPESPMSVEEVAPETGNGMVVEEAPVSQEVVIGIDLGSQNCRVATCHAESRMPTVLLNEVSNLETPSMVSFRGSERFIGEAATAHASSAPRTTFRTYLPFLGKPPKSVDQNHLARTLFPVSASEDGHHTLVEIQRAGHDEPSKVYLEQIVAMNLHQLANIAAGVHPDAAPKTCVIAVPSAFDAHQRQAVMDAAHIAGLNCIQVLGSATAAATTFATTHRVPEGETSKILLVDVGHLYFSVQAVELTHSSVRVVASSTDTAGGGCFHWNLQEALAERLKSKFGWDLSSQTGNLKARARLHDACEKAKKLLSTLPQTDVEIECFIDDKDVREKVTREELQKLCEEQLQKIEQLTKDTLAGAGWSPEELASVEVIGGGSRIPEVQARLVSAVGGRQLSHHLDSSSAVVTGAALMAANHLGFPFQSSPIAVDEGPAGTVDGTNGMGAKQLEEAIAVEAELSEADTLRKKIGMARNNIETFLFSTRDAVNSDAFASYLPDNTKTELLAYVEELENWMYEDEIDSLSLQQLEDKLATIKARMQAIAPQYVERQDALQAEREAAAKAAAEEAAKLAATPGVSSRDKDERPLTKAERLAAATKKKNQGNVCFKDDDIDRATGCYIKAIGFVESINNASEEEKKEIDAIELSCRLNLAQCYLKNKMWKRAIENCRMALKIDENNTKALFRRAKAHIGLHDHDLAKADLEKGLEIDPDNNEFKKELAALAKKVEAAKANEKKMFAKMFG